MTAAFTEFRLTRRPDAFRRVFDATAPAIARLLFALGADAHDIEDVLQSTFVTALEKADQFDASRDLTSWLCGIAVRHLRMEQRRARRRVVGLDASPADVTEPGDVVVRFEVAREVRNAIAQLPPAQHPVVELTLFEGLSPTEIAARLHRSPSTVRSQLQRGLERLRNRMPPDWTRGAAIAGLWQLAGTARITALCARVCAAASDAVVRESAAVATDRFAAGRLTSGRGRLAFVATSIAVAIAIMVAGLLGWGSQPSAKASARQSTSAEQDSNAPTLRNASETPDRVAADTVADPSPTAADVLAAVRLVRPSGAPVPEGAVLRLMTPWHPDESMRDRYATGSVYTATTNSAGIAQFSVPSNAVERPAVVAFDDGAAFSEPFALRPIAEHVERIVVPTVLEIAGRVTDAQSGDPISGATVFVTGRNHVLPGFEAGTSGPDGRYEIVAAGSGEQLGFWIEAPGYEPSQLKSRLQADGSLREDFALTRARRSVRARVVTRGQMPPGSHVEVSLTPIDRGALQLPVRRRGLAPGDAEVVFDGVPTVSHAAVARMRTPSGRWLTSAPTRVGPAEPDAPITLVVHAGVEVTGRVLDAAGLPIAGATVCVLPDLRGSMRRMISRSVERTRSGVDGKFAADSVLPGTRILAVFVGGSLAFAERVEVGARGIDHDCHIDSDRSIEGQVVGPRGQPIAGAFIEIAATDLDGLEGGYRSLRTSADGTFAAYGLGPGDHALGVTPAGSHRLRGPAWVTRTVSSGTRELLVRLTDGDEPRSRWRATVTNPDGSPGGGAILRLRATSGGRVHEWTADANGVVATDPLPAGEYDLWLRSERGCAVLPGIRPTDSTDAPPERVRLETPAALEVRVTNVPDGRTALVHCKHERRLLRAVAGYDHESHGNVHRFEAMTPGRWQVHVRGPGLPYLVDEIELASGDARLVEIAFPDRPATEVVFDIDHLWNPAVFGTARMEIVCTDDGRTIWDELVPLRDDPFAPRFLLEPGSYAARMVTSFGAHGERKFRVTGAPSRVRVVVE